MLVLLFRSFLLSSCCWLVRWVQAVYELSGKPAYIFGLQNRGILEVGAHADLLLFDPATVGSTETVGIPSTAMLIC